MRLLLYFFIDVEGTESRRGLMKLLSRVVFVRDRKATLSSCSRVVSRTRRKDLFTARRLKQSKRRKRQQEKLMS
jgi:hypothetical protein